MMKLFYWSEWTIKLMLWLREKICNVGKKKKKADGKKDNFIEWK